MDRTLEPGESFAFTFNGEDFDDDFGSRAEAVDAALEAAGERYEEPRGFTTAIVSAREPVDADERADLEDRGWSHFFDVACEVEHDSEGDPL